MSEMPIGPLRRRMIEDMTVRQLVGKTQANDIRHVRTFTGCPGRSPDVASLTPFGVEEARYPSFEYGGTQALAAAARFLDFDSLIVPGAQSPALHLIAFPDEISETSALTVLDTEPVDRQAWRQRRR